MNSTNYGPLNAVVTSSRQDGNSWSANPSAINYGGSNTYGSKHAFLGTGSLGLYVTYQLQTSQGVTVATVEIDTYCNERSFIDSIEMSCTPSKAQDDLCLYIGISNPTCNENGVINNEHYTGNLVADGSGYQRNR
eukprot:Awhi_evm2s13264